MTMQKRFRLSTRAFGAEPGMPDVAALARWVAGHRGTTADITTYLLDQSLAPQLGAGIDRPCAGGKFCADRIRASLIGVEKGCVTDEIAVRTEALIEDAAGIVVQKRGVWCTLPAPHMLGLSDAYYHDEEEWCYAITGAYRTLMRAMRDCGIPGHVLICEKAEEAEIAALAGQKQFFFQPETDRGSLESLMEHQRQIAVRPDQLATVFDLSNEYELRKIIVVDADAEAIARALLHLDPDQVSAGGYCMDGCDEYWNNLVDAAVYTR